MEGDRSWCRSVPQFWGRSLLRAPPALPVQPSAILLPWAAWKLCLPVTAAHTSRHSGAPFPWITLGQSPNHHNSYRLRELWGDAADHKQFCLRIPKTLLSPHAGACSDLITLHQTVPGCGAGSVWLSKNCGGHGLVGQTSVVEIQTVPLEPSSHRWPAAPKLSLDQHTSTESAECPSPTHLCPRSPLPWPFSLSWKWIEEDT